MSSESDVIVVAVRRAFAELSDAAERLLSDFAAAEDAAGALEPDLALLVLDVFGGITVPARAEHGKEERRTRRARPALDRLAGTAGAAPAPVAAAQRGRAPALAGTGPSRRSESTTAVGAPVSAEPLPPVFPLRGGAARAPAASGAASGGTQPPTVAAAAAEAGASPGVAAAGTPPDAAPGAAAPAEATGGTLELITRLTESILAAKAGGAAAVPSAAASGATAGASSAAGSSFLAETLRSLGGQTAAAFGVEPGGAPAPAAPSPTAETNRASSPPDLDAPSGAGRTDAELGTAATPAAIPPAGPPAAENGVARRAGEPEPDPASLAALVNDALVEQARRHGLELG